MNKTPTLLIIVPTLNSYKVLPRLINSIKNQIYQEWKLLFVDGNSNLNHQKWIEECCKKDSRIKTLAEEIIEN